MTDRDAIQAILHQVQAGEITPQEATDRLIAAENAETLQSLVERLGTPPDDIVFAWCDQLRSIASAYEADTGDPLPEIDLSRWAITSDGDLLLDGRRFKTSDYAPRASQVSLDRVLDFQRKWVPDGQVSRSAEPNTIAARFPVKTPAGEADTKATSNGSEPKSDVVHASSGQATRLVMFVGIAACAAAAAFILFRASGPSSEPVAEISSPDSTRAAAVTTAPTNIDIDAPTTDVVGEESSAEIVTLETFEPSEELEPDPELENELSMSLEGLMPSLDDFKSKPPAAADTPDSDPAQPENTNVDASGSDPPAKSDEPTEGQIADDEPIPTESPQETRPMPAASVQLADPGEVDVPVLLADRPLQELKIAFPYDVPVEVKQQDDVWAIRDKRKDVTLAVIRRSEQGTELNWSKTAKQSPVVSSLVHGRLKDDADNSIYLRPQVESDPWAFDFQKTDVMPTWDLGGPVPPQVSNLEVKFQLPDDIEFGWIDPVEATEIRRGRGTAVINVAGEEEVAVAIRFDVRCTRKLAIRMRFAARLDPSMNWQIVSNPLLTQFSNQLAERASMINHESDRLAKVYRSLDQRDAKRYIRNKQDHVKDLSKQTETAAKRVAKLQTLMARLESEAKIGFRVWVDWPDGQQDLLTAMGTDQEP